jgi:hypothetical protein
MKEKIVRINNYISRRKITFLCGGLLWGGLMLSGCNSFMTLAMEKTGRALDGSAFAEKTAARYEARRVEGAAADMEVRETVNKAGDPSLLISLKEFPEIRFRGSAPGADGNFYLTGLEYLGGNFSGWNEFTLDLSGAGRFVKSEAAAVLSLSAPPEPVQISAGKIRRNESRLTGDEALVSLRNRYERILALTEWMRRREGAPEYLGPEVFDVYWRPILLPETVSKKNRHPNWKKENARWVRAEDVKWNATYTESLLPEDLRVLRDSGALLRDWEEAFQWICVEYAWEKIGGYLSGEITLKRIK